MEVADVAKYNRQVLRLLNDTVDDLAVHGSEPYELGNGDVVGVKLAVYRATPLVSRKSSIFPSNFSVPAFPFPPTWKLPGAGKV